MKFHGIFYTTAFGDPCKVHVFFNHIFVYKSLYRFRILIEFI